METFGHHFCVALNALTQTPEFSSERTPITMPHADSTLPELHESSVKNEENEEEKDEDNEMDER